MAEKNESYAYFAIKGAFDPSDISAKVGVLPTKAFAAGELIPKANKKREFSGWFLYSRLNRSNAIELHVADVLDQMDAKKNEFKELSIELGGLIELVGFFPEFYPGIFFERELVERLAYYALSVDFDFYFPSAVEGVGPEGTTT
ncbi:MAG TPA: DUF4279 domain-containing protein [Candidatus Angelobacter sp.]|nr:DUF4279 domain-containing protein [Candidatus Angelobacter sp.]